MNATNLSRRELLLLSRNIGVVTFTAGAVAGFAPAFAQNLPVMNQPFWLTTIHPQTYSNAVGDWEKAFAGKAKINVVGVSTAPEIMSGVAGGSFDMAYLGSTAIVTGMANDLDMSMVYINDINRSMDALIARRGSGINAIADIKGKRVATPFNSTSHLGLMWSLEAAGIKPTEIELINMRPDQIMAAWSRSDVDATYVWGSFMQRAVADNGVVITDNGKLMVRGLMIFLGIIVRNEFKRNHPDLVLTYLTEFNRTAQVWKNNQDAVVAKVAEYFKISLSDAHANVTARAYLSPAEQMNESYMGAPGAKDTGVLRALRKTAEYLKGQNQINAIPASFDKFVDSSFIARMAS